HRRRRPDHAAVQRARRRARRALPAQGVRGGRHRRHDLRLLPVRPAPRGEAAMSPGRRLAVIASVAVGATLVPAIAVLDAPPRHREQRLDARRVQDLQQHENAIAAYHAGHKALPDDLAALRAMPGWNLAPGDPETGAPYGYEVLGERSYRLCAKFSTDTAAAE